MTEQTDTGEAPEDKEQVLDQCRALAHMARAIASVHEQIAKSYATMSNAEAEEALTRVIGFRTARMMEWLGDELNGMGAVVEAEDAWTFPIMERAQVRFPSPTQTEGE